MPCSYLNAKGLPCGIATKSKVCHIHARFEISKQLQHKHKLSEIIHKYRSSITELINENASLKRDQEENEAKISSLTKQNQDLEDQKDVMRLEIEQLREDVDSYNQIKEFEKLYSQVRDICQTDKYAVIMSHLKLKYSWSRNQLLELFNHESPYDEFHRLRNIRNTLAHQI